MGCDAHVIIERWTGSYFEFIGAFEPWRSYSVFGQIAPVRGGDGDLGYEAKRPPTSSNPISEALFDKWGDDAHNLRILESADIANLVDWVFDDDLEGDFSRWLCGSEDPWIDWGRLIVEGKPLRMFIWFDN